MVPGRRRRRRTKVERGSMRLVATGGIIGIAVVIGAVLVGQDVAMADGAHGHDGPPDARADRARLISRTTRTASSSDAQPASA
jgi:hypothetical protein